MNAALLFNSDDAKFGGSYGDPIRDFVFGLGLIQASGRHMKISVGDVLTYGKYRNQEQFESLMVKVYSSGTRALYHEDRLGDVLGVGTVYALTFENMTVNLAQDLHVALSEDSSYLGVLEVNYAHGPHLALFRNSMIPLYRVEGSTCRVFYSMGEEDSRDDYEIEAMSKLGFSDVAWEDRGGHGTIFDDYDTLEHFQRIAIFRDVIQGLIEGGEDAASELVMVLEDLNPQLFTVLGAAVVALERAENAEDVAQAALSGRRYLEKLADVLFPARDGKLNGRRVGKSEYRNRIWAYISENLRAYPERVEVLGKEVDRLVEEFNAGLHGDREGPRILKALANAGELTAALLALSSSKSRQPYYAFQKRIVEFLREAAERHGKRE
jgi:hypothetical protein